ETITEHLVETELGFDAGPADFRPLATPGPGGAPAIMQGEPDGATLSMSVEHHLNALFKTHGEQLPPAGLYHRVLREVEGPLISAALAATRGNQIKAAELLGLNRNTLRKKVRELDIRLMRSPR
ncbi:MAG: nitrogen regulation protein NR(I), partial [Beijerinckiaceae bacterium]|nr:nitrogen regulation protein NR(I) [Beijerinckiaceae bacterium]